MHFDDSLFESDSKQQDKRVDVSQIKYTAKKCELNWFTEPKYDSCTDSSSPDSDFMLTKFRADLLYLQRQYEQAVMLYEATLRAVPPSNTVVVREVTESVARCSLHLSQPELALEKAWLLVHPPHENDSSAWKLIADCQGAMADTAAQALSLQKCASLQRYQSSYWTSLAGAYDRLSEQCLSNTHMAMEWRELSSLLETTIALFRPYFSWLPLSDGHGRRRPVCNHGDGSEGVSSEHLCCHGSCVFSDLRLTSCVYTDVIVKMTAHRRLCVNFDPASSLCLVHSPFTVLNSGQVRLGDWVGGLERLTANGHSQFVGECVSSFLVMAKCSCLLWARQLLLYFVRYSHSFVREAHEKALSELELRLHSCDPTVRSFLEIYFNKNRVFEESQNKDDKQ